MGGCGVVKAAVSVPARDSVLLSFTEDEALVWIGGEPSPIHCYRTPAVYGLAAGIAGRLGKKLVTA